MSTGLVPVGLAPTGLGPAPAAAAGGSLTTNLGTKSIADQGQISGIINALDARTKAGDPAALGIGAALGLLTKSGAGQSLGLLTVLDTLTKQGLQATTGTGVSPDIDTGVEFDGTTDYLTRGADLDGISDAKVGIVSFWFQTTASACRILINNTARFLVAVDASGKISIIGRNASDTVILSVTSTTAWNDGNWHHCVASWDLSATIVQLYVDDQDDATVLTATNDTIDYTGSNWAIGASTSGALKFAGCLGEPAFWIEALDLSSSANRDKFTQAASRVSLGADGSTPTGTQPAIYQSGAASQWTHNFGSGGDFTDNGSLADCAIGDFAGPSMTTSLGVKTLGDQAQVVGLITAIDALLGEGAAAALGIGTAAGAKALAGLAATLGSGNGITTNLAALTSAGLGQALGLGTALDTKTIAGLTASLGSAGALSTNLATLSKEGQSAALGLLTALDALSRTERSQILGLLTSSASKTVTEYPANFGGAGLSTNLATLSITTLAAGITVWELGDAMAAAYDDLDVFFDRVYGFAETVLVDGDTISGLFDDHSAIGGERQGPMVRLRTSDVDAYAIDQGTLLTIRGRAFEVHGVQPDGVGVSTLVLWEPA